MSDNASFPNPSPPLTEIATAADDLTQAFSLVQAAKSEVTTRVVNQDNAEARLDQGFDQACRLRGKHRWKRRQSDYKGRHGNQGV